MVEMVGVQLYKSLVRPHLEYGVPVWAAVSAKDLDKVEQTQVQCLKRITGAKAHSSGCALEVITGTFPMKIRIRELCSREYLRIMFTDQGNQLRQLFDTSSRKGLMFCPLNYLSVMAKQLNRRLDGCSLSSEPNVSATAVLQPAKVMKVAVHLATALIFTINLSLKSGMFWQKFFVSLKIRKECLLWFTLMDLCMMLLLDVEHVQLFWFL